MTKIELVKLASKSLEEDVVSEFANALSERRFTKARMIAEANYEVAKEYLYENAIKDHCDPLVMSNFRFANSLMDETIDFIITNSDVV